MFNCLIDRNTSDKLQLEINNKNRINNKRGNIRRQYLLSQSFKKIEFRPHSNYNQNSYQYNSYYNNNNDLNNSKRAKSNFHPKTNYKLRLNNEEKKLTYNSTRNDIENKYAQKK